MKLMASECRPERSEEACHAAIWGKSIPERGKCKSPRIRVCLAWFRIEQFCGEVSARESALGGKMGSST